MEPLRFERVLKEKVWGGRRFEVFPGVELPAGKPYGESWEVSAHPNGPSVVAEGPWAGRTLNDLAAREGAALVGRSVFERYGTTFPLLIKYLDVHDKLSVQVHPDDAYALAREGEFGKSECWYILDASADAVLILGTAPGLTAGEFRARAARGEWTGLFREVPVRTGDFVHVVPGTVHATLRGSVLICEVQQSSDTTYRIYDYDRLENGRPRALHLDKAAEVIRFAEEPRISRAGTRERIAGDGFIAEPLVADSHYTVDRLEVSGRCPLPAEDRFAVLSVLEGKGGLVHGGRTFPLRSGQTWLVPAGEASVLEGPVTVLRSRP